MPPLIQETNTPIMTDEVRAEHLPAVDLIEVEQSTERVGLRSIGKAFWADIRSKGPGDIPAAAGFAAFTLQGIWGRIDASAFNGLANNFPATFKDVSRLPKLKTMTSKLPGIEVAAHETRPTHFQRSLSLQAGPGIVGYILTAAVQGQDKTERKQLGRKLSLDCALFWGTVAATTAVSIELLGKENSWAKEITALSHNKLFWLGTALSVPLVKRLTKNLVIPSVRFAGTALRSGANRFTQLWADKPTPPLTSPPINSEAN